MRIDLVAVEVQQGYFPRPRSARRGQPARRVRPAPDAMVRDGRVRNPRFGARHVAVDAAIGRAARAAPGRRQGTASLGMTLKAAGPVVAHLRLGRWNRVRIVAGNTAESSLARLVAAAGLHLLGVTTHHRAIGELGAPSEDGHELVQRQARPVIEQFPTAADNADLALKMTLLADRVAQR